METDGKKNANSVVSFIFDCLEKKLPQFPNVKNIVFLSDAAGGQNRNLTMIKFCSRYAKTRNVDIAQVFPVGGHSFSQYDRKFGIVRKQISKKEVIGTAKPYLTAMVTCRQEPCSFKVIMDRDILKEWDEALCHLFLSKSSSKLNKFSLMKYVIIKIKQDGSLLCSENY